ncbi:hypothetical protein [Enterobacter hormaechei]|uniref:hypothetical protein n=1 Tax=Enterobacter hormaechei TaxID=158836 RepID=UPI003D6F4B26
MSTITKESIADTIEGLELLANRGIQSVHIDMAIAGMRRLLASLEAEAVHQFIYNNPYEEGYTEWLDCNKDYFNGVPEDCRRILYTAPPAPVSVNDERYQHLSELYHAQEKRLFKLAQRIKGPSFDKYAHSPSQAIDVLESALFGEHDDDCRAAMLQGAEPVTTAYKLPAIGWLRADYQDDNRGLRGNAPLFVLGKKDPSTVWGLDYIPLTSNSPVIPDGWALVPEEPTHEMLEAGDEQFGTYDVYRRMIAASPQQEVKP